MTAVGRSVPDPFKSQLREIFTFVIDVGKSVLTTKHFLLIKFNTQILINAMTDLSVRVNQIFSIPSKIQRINDANAFDGKAFLCGNNG